jgi:hypothetical protein
MSGHHKNAKWANHAKKARAIIKAQLPLPCVHCGSPVFDDQLWDVGHIVDLAQGGNTKDYGASHRRCNRSAGGTAGANIVNRRKKNTREW